MGIIDDHNEETDTRSRAHVVASALHKATNYQLRRVAEAFVAYYSRGGGCSNCGGLPHAATCFVGRFQQAMGATTDVNAVDPPAEGRERGLRASQDRPSVAVVVPPQEEAADVQALMEVLPTATHRNMLRRLLDSPYFPPVPAASEGDKK